VARRRIGLDEQVRADQLAAPVWMNGARPVTSS